MSIFISVFIFMKQLVVEFRNSLSHHVLAGIDCCVVYYGGKTSTKFKEIVSTKKSQTTSPL